jgi:DNA-binding CsgD family transcriptional regulator
VAGDDVLADEVVDALDARRAAAEDAALLPDTIARGMALLLRNESDRGLLLLESADLRAWRDVNAPLRPYSVLLPAHAAAAVGDDATMYAITSAHVAECRRRGLIGMLPEALLLLARAEVFMGRHRHATANALEGLRIVRDTGQARELGYQGVVLAELAAVQGDEDRCRMLAEQTIAAATERGVAAAAAWSRHALGLLDLGLGRYDSAFEHMSEMRWLLPAMTFTRLSDQIEAAFRGGQPDRVEAAFTSLQPWAEHASQPWARGVVARCRALATAYEEAEPFFDAAVRVHAEGGGRPFERARTHLLYGEWLRRARRPSDARSQLRAALETFERLEARPWAERARGELRAAGEDIAPAQAADPLGGLTPQELQVVRLAATGATNREIAGQLFLSPRTVGYHLYKAYPKLGVSSRRGLARLDLGHDSHEHEVRAG